LRETNEHAIIFSQWDDLLKRVGRILNENGVKNVFCKGNCYQRDKAIREFNDDDKVKVIMLSSESAASGTNLTKATQVILLDPIYGNYKYRKGQERQAIGRAHRLGQKNTIKIVRLIIKDSVEEEIYDLNNAEDAKNQGMNTLINEVEVN
jgi:SNF2 family DNA or RNA helicase